MWLNTAWVFAGFSLSRSVAALSPGWGHSRAAAAFIARELRQAAVSIL